MKNLLRSVRHAALKIYYGPSMKEKLSHTRVLPESFTRALHAKGLRLNHNRAYYFHYNPNFEFYRLASIFHAHQSPESWSMQHSDYYSGAGTCLNIFLGKFAGGEFLNKLDAEGRELWIDANQNLPNILRKELRYVTLILREVNSVQASEDDIARGLKQKFPHLIQKIPEGSEIEFTRSEMGLLAYTNPAVKEDPISAFNRSLHSELQAAALEVLGDIQRDFRTHLVFPDMTLTRDDT